MACVAKCTSWQFLYINSAFAPAPDEIVGNLYKVKSRKRRHLFFYTFYSEKLSARTSTQLFNTDGQLIINYCTTSAWG